MSRKFPLALFKEAIYIILHVPSAAETYETRCNPFIVSYCIYIYVSVMMMWFLLVSRQTAPQQEERERDERVRDFTLPPICRSEPRPPKDPCLRHLASKGRSFTGRIII
eukprot:scaffold10157_cov73-Cylindrotheca_fusiformis.AAC.2